jgi:quinoprotein dehydrogenase-associated probable ABC transporter substrate-binding protein
MKMKRTVVSFAVCVVLAGLLGFVSVGALAQGSATTWTLRVCAAKDNLPYSNEQQQGFENKIISLLAQDLHAKLSYLWLPKLQVAKQNLLLLNEDKCDVFLNVGGDSTDFLLTLAYYQTTYFFVYRTDAPFKITSLNNAVLKKLHIGVVTVSPPAIALGARGITDNVHHYSPVSNDPASQMVDDVVNKKLDVAVIFGPLAGYSAKQQKAESELEFVPVTPQVGPSGLSMVYPTSMGLRQGDTNLRDLLNQALADKWDDIQKVLKSYNIPLLPLPKPVISTGG